MENINFVDKDDNIIGVGPVQEAVKKGLRYRIARVEIYNQKGELLIQKRVMHARSYPGRWDNSAAGHVDEGEVYEVAAYRELKEEIGLESTVLKEIGKIYMENVEGDRIYNRFSMLYRGTSDGPLVIDEHEVAEVRWIKTEELLEEMKKSPDDFVPGFVGTFTQFRNV